MNFAAGCADERFLALGAEIPPRFPVPPQFSFVAVRIVGDQAWLSGHGPNRSNSPPAFDYVGKIGADLTVEQGRMAARLAGLNMLVSLRDAIGSLDKVECIVRCDCFVASAPGFGGQSAVANGCTDLLRDVFGDAGLGTRMAIGAAELPFNMAVETSLVACLRDHRKEKF